MNILFANFVSGRGSRTFRRTMLSAMLAPLLFAAAGGFLLTLDLDEAAMVDSPRSEAPAAASPARAEVLMDRHHCWTGEAPDDLGAFGPGHAVVTINGRTRYTSADAGYGIWLEGEPGKLHGFCR